MTTGTIILPILGFNLDGAVPPGVKWTAKNRPYLTLDGTTDELFEISFKNPGDYASGMTAVVQYSMASAITNNVAIRSEVMAIAAAENILTDNFAAVEKSADSVVPGTLNDMKVITEALTTPTIAAGDYLSFIFGRENATTGTNAAGDMYIWSVTLEYTTT